jgi:hypothetical protein
MSLIHDAALLRASAPIVFSLAWNPVRSDSD